MPRLWHIKTVVATWMTNPVDQATDVQRCTTTVTTVAGGSGGITTKEFCVNRVEANYMPAAESPFFALGQGNYMHL